MPVGSPTVTVRRRLCILTHAFVALVLVLSPIGRAFAGIDTAMLGHAGAASIGAMASALVSTDHDGGGESAGRVDPGHDCHDPGELCAADCGACPGSAVAVPTSFRALRPVSRTTTPRPVGAPAIAARRSLDVPFRPPIERGARAG